ncbi:branched-chain amino acid ABC transporter permease [Mesorhizobium sp. RMAD-H1]|uniref:branched-chain amino acid ABC transporter permease n=1 Tax=Mesorhizobium sp. RMAD-H1 TaxID=2587065 RepID=UPI00160D6A2E|nr:branched-chain amino acid ABC transporter permease [Mesorhizobium sp. RMAD-H1]MBB2971553.1 branched-chain amino acid transport system permease protein [Mesorhizobium sp. RMAD-H1]
MNTTIAVLLAQNGLMNGAIYALLALVLVMVFSVTRVILIPQGEIVAYAALTLAAVRTGQTPGTVWLLCGAGLLAAAMECAAAWRTGGYGGSMKRASLYAVLPIAIAVLAWTCIPLKPGAWFDVLMTLLLVVPLGPLMYRIAFRPLGDAPVLVLLIIAMAVHYVLTGLGLVFFGAEGVRSSPIMAGRVQIAGISISLQTLFVIAASLVMIIAMALFFSRTLHGKALRATAFNRTGARLVGIRTESAGMLTFLLAALIGAVSGLLIAPLTTIYYDTGFLIGLKGFVAGILGGLVSYPLAALGAVSIGLIESFSSFWASIFKDVIVFSLLIPILLWRNLKAEELEENDE